MSRKVTLKILSVLLIFIAIIKPATVKGQEYSKQDLLNVHLHYKDAQVSMVYLEKLKGYLPDYRNQPEKGYTAKLLGGKDRELFKIIFDFPLYVFAPPDSKLSPKVLNEVDHTLTLPYLKDAKKLEIGDPQGKVLISRELTKDSFVTPQATVTTKKEGVFKKITGWLNEIYRKIATFTEKLILRKESKAPQAKQVSPTPVPAIDADIQKIAKLAPFSTDFMTVLYFDKSQSFSVTIEKAPFEVNKKLALKWFTDHEIRDLCKLNLEFTASTVVKKRGTLTQEERSTPGCPLLPQT